MARRPRDERRRFGRRVHALRVERGLSQTDVGERCGLDRAYMSGLEHGMRNPTLDTIVRLASAFDVAVAELFD